MWSPTHSPPHSARFRFFKHAVANVLSGGSAAILAVAVPPFLARLMPRDEFGTWVLVLQVAAYTNFFKFGIEAAIGRFAAETLARDDGEGRDRIVSAGMAIMVGAAAAALAAQAVVIREVPHWFARMPGALQHQAQLALCIVGGTLALSLPASVYGGICAGLERYDVTAAINGLAKMASATALVVAAAFHAPLPAIAAAWAAPNIAGYLAQYLAVRRLVPMLRINAGLIDGLHLRRAVQVCAGLSVWSGAMLMISGLDSTLVAHFDFPALAFYVNAAALVAVVAGVQNAVFASLVPISAAEDGSERARHRLGSVLATTTRYSMYLLLLTAIPLLLCSRPLLLAWLGHGYVVETTGYLRILVVANAVRLCATPYAAMLVGTGQQHFAILASVVEGIVNLGASILLARHFGARGVAWGTMIGAAVGIASTFGFTMPRTQKIQIPPLRLLREGILRPLLTTGPLIAALCLAAAGAHAAESCVAVAAGAAISLLLLWHLGMSQKERDWVSCRWRRRRRVSVGA